MDEHSIGSIYIDRSIVEMNRAGKSFRDRVQRFVLKFNLVRQVCMNDLFKDKNV